jgi:hypothetical protein
VSFRRRLNDYVADAREENVPKKTSQFMFHFVLMNSCTASATGKLSPAVSRVHLQSQLEAGVPRALLWGFSSRSIPECGAEIPSLAIRL